MSVDVSLGDTTRSSQVGSQLGSVFRKTCSHPEYAGMNQSNCHAMQLKRDRMQHRNGLDNPLSGSYPICFVVVGGDTWICTCMAAWIT